MDGRFLEGPVGIRCEGAVFEDKVLAVAQRLRAGNTAADETEIPGVPTEVLAIDFGVVNGAVLAVPKRIFGVEDSVADFEVAGVLENVFADQPKLADR